MKNIVIKYAYLLVLAASVLQCDTDTSNATLKFHPNDPFRTAITPSQTFEIDAKKDNVVEGENGTILVLPSGCFKNADGQTAIENIQVELSEALTLDEMLLSNLTTTSNGKLLETDGMIYLNATANGEQLFIDKANPVYIEIPTSAKKPGMMAYKGLRDESGNMNWIEPKELEKYLVTVDINLLNFYPDGFEDEVLTGLPFRNHETVTKALTDSLYYSLSNSDMPELVEDVVPVEYNEAYYNKNKAVVNGKYTDNSYMVTEDGQDTVWYSQVAEAAAECGIDPAIIKVIWSEKYQNTLIATREFETRLQTIFKTCRNDIIEIYINNLDKNLWELDSMAAITLNEHLQYGDFYDYYKQGLTNVKDASVYAEILRGYYEKRLKKIKAELERAKKEVAIELQKKNEIAQKTVNKYKKLLDKREKYRMETYGFEWSETGWINIDRGTIPKTWGPKKLEMIVQDGKNFDRVYSYVVYTSIKSLYRLNSSDNETFYVGNNQDKEMLMPEKEMAVGISIGYTGETPYLAIKEFETGSDFELKMVLEKSSTQGIKTAIKPYDRYKQENKIDKDLEFMALFAKEKKRQERLKSEREFIDRLRRKASPCCTDSSWIVGLGG